MKRAEHVRDVELPHDFAAVITESSRADLRMVSSGARFLAPGPATVASLTGPVLIVASSPQFLAESLKPLENTDQDVWVLLSDTNAERLASMLEDNDDWSVTARVTDPQHLAWQVRRSTDDDSSLEDVVMGLRLAVQAESTGLDRPVVLPAPKDAKERPVTLLSLVKKRVPTRMKKQIKRTLGRK